MGGGPLKYPAIKQMIEDQAEFDGKKMKNNDGPTEYKSPKANRETAGNQEREIQNQPSMIFGESLLIENSMDHGGSKLGRISEVRAAKMRSDLEKITSKS